MDSRLSAPENSPPRPAGPRPAPGQGGGGTSEAWSWAAAACSAALLYLGTGLSPVAALTWIAPLPILLLAPRVSARRATALAFLAYLAGSANSWDYFLRPRPSLAVPLPAALSILIGGSVLFAVAVLLFRALLVRGRAVLATLAAPAAWVGVLHLASLASPSGVMGTLATTQADVTPVVQIASVTGFWGVEYLVLLVPAAIAACSAPGIPAATRLRAGAAGLALSALALGYGALRLQGPPTAEGSRHVVVLARNQGHWAADVATPEGRELVAAYAEQIAGLPEGSGIVVLPEAGFAADDASLPALLGPMERAARARGADIVIGLLHTTGGIRYNSALAVLADGGAPAEYHRWNAGMDQLSRTGHALAYLPGSPRVGMVVCGDVNFPRPTRDYAAAGARLLAVPASDEDVDGWQHSRTALLRGVENGLAVAWSDQRGVPMISDPWGRVRAETRTSPEAGEDSFAMAAATVPSGPGATLYTRFGDWFPWLCLLTALAAPLIAAGRRKGARRD
ncbi:apolipoprotein N-acyltransferase [Sphaerisporangium melleum]|uniref:Apolipoprotein N-acyltransferase n=1 Tax=Sphaerisporangium melleum TaxID=321316 RepID=A0A917QVN6_9ACTN|nr:nitrilase-related carbon-nitrogen hydrolase [Sphaerisporangium melleum]GGK70378.1 apolipoprotein N-acyltransferase [Sphaerisporangium melleum]GII70295.1 apolipoprotein N-acyltransferase [Sphaerisporangium melleum]